MSIQDFIEKKKFSRRSFLKGLAALGSASLLGGCGNKLSDVVGEYSTDKEETVKAVWKNAPRSR